jgi:hypothetical protein
MSARDLTASTSRRCIRGRSSIVLARRVADRLASMRWVYIRAFWPLPMHRTTPSTRITCTDAKSCFGGGRADVRTWVICRRPTARSKARGHFSVPVIAKSRPVPGQNEGTIQKPCFTGCPAHSSFNARPYGRAIELGAARERHRL